MARYFVTGGTGFIGSRLVRQLLGDGHAVVALVRNPSAADELAALGAEVRQGDVTDRASLRGPMAGADGVFHVAGWYEIGVRDRSRAYPVNVEGTRNTLEVMRELGIPRGVYTSTLAVFGDTHGRTVDEDYRAGGPWLSEYDLTKWLAHYEVAEPLMRAGLPLVIVQPGLTYGPRDPSSVGQLLRSYLQRRLPAVPGGTAYCWGHVDDIARGHILAMQRGRVGESYIIGGPPHTLAEALHTAERLTGVPAPALEVPPAVLRGLAGLIQRVERVLRLPGPYSAEYLRVGAGVTYLGSNARARRELGLEMRPLETGLRETLIEEIRRLGLAATVQ